jgi:hypothetical protein
MMTLNLLYSMNAALSHFKLYHSPISPGPYYVGKALQAGPNTRSALVGHG